MIAFAILWILSVGDADLGLEPEGKTYGRSYSVLCDLALSSRCDASPYGLSYASLRQP